MVCYLLDFPYSLYIGEDSCIVCNFKRDSLYGSYKFYEPDEMMNVCFDGAYDGQEFTYRQTSYSLLPDFATLIGEPIDFSKLSTPWVYKSEMNKDICLISWQYDERFIVQKMDIGIWEKNKRGSLYLQILSLFYLYKYMLYLDNRVTIENETPGENDLENIFPEYMAAEYILYKKVKGKLPSSYFTTKTNAIGYMFHPTRYQTNIVIIWQVGKSKHCEIYKKLPVSIARMEKESLIKDLEGGIIIVPYCFFLLFKIISYLIITVYYTKDQLAEMTIPPYEPWRVNNAPHKPPASVASGISDNADGENNPFEMEGNSINRIYIINYKDLTTSIMQNIQSIDPSKLKARIPAKQMWNVNTLDIKTCTNIQKSYVVFLQTKELKRVILVLTIAILKSGTYSKHHAACSKRYI